ncbi:MAG: hypothetical protein DRQ47_03950 [Gammaproteobacteria bacterium]|nr:MAG: hypothetical protein DRQ47_03950 [Gammaproteobacteria bacterium]
MEVLHLISIASALFIFWLFAQAGAHKLNPANDSYYTSLVVDYGWASQLTAIIIIKSVGIFELGIALAILFPPTRPMIALIAAGLLFVYLLNMAFQLYQGRRDLDCGCSGPGAELKISGHLLLRNFLMMMIALFCLVPTQNNGSGYWVLGALLAMVGILVTLSSEQLISNAQKLQALR